MSVLIQPLLSAATELRWHARLQQADVIVHLDIGDDYITLVASGERFPKVLQAAHKLAADLDLLADQLGYGECARCEQYRPICSFHEDADESWCEACTEAYEDEGREQAAETIRDRTETARQMDGAW